MPGRMWLDSKIDVFLEELAASSMHLGRHRAGELITGQVRAIAALLRVTEATWLAERGYEDEVIVVIHMDCPLHKIVRKPVDDVLGDQ